MSTLISYLCLSLLAFASLDINEAAHNSRNKSYKVLLMPAQVASHIVLFSGMGEALVENGHEAHMLKHGSISIPSQYKNAGIKEVNYEVKGEAIHPMLTNEFQILIGEFSKRGMFSTFHKVFPLFQRMCSDVLSNEDLYKKLELAKYDFVLVDNLFGLDCYFAVPHRLQVPYGNLMIFPPFELFSLTLQTNYITPTLPFMFTPEPSFLKRFAQTILLNVATTITRASQDMQLIHHYTRDHPIGSFSELTQNVKLWLVDADPIVDVPRHNAPNVIYVGGLSTRDAQPLPTAMAKFADTAKEGLVVVSFGGSLTADFPQDHLEKLMKALNALKYKVIIRLKTKPPFPLRNGIMLSDWMPQNDLLAHKNTILFITHCGAGSVNEAIYHGVPMVGIPNQKEQAYNGKRMVHKGFGEMLDRNEFTAEELVDIVQKTTSKDNKYKKAVARASMLIKSRRSKPGEEAVYWIEHVIEFGADHLIPYTAQLRWYEILMLDVLGLILLILAVFIFIVVKCTKCLGRLCCGKKSKRKQKSS